jgi:hypothetical protein
MTMMYIQKVHIQHIILRVVEYFTLINMIIISINYILSETCVKGKNGKCQCLSDIFVSR